jgi:two-component system phosphate regulon sensor histidine kinase PhoR
VALGRTQLSAALKALQAELEGGPRADLGREVSELATLLVERELRRLGALRDPAEQELLSALPDAAGIVAKDGRIRVSNAALDALSAGGRSLGLTPLELTRSGELAEAVRRALEGSARRLDVEFARRAFVAQLTPLLRGEVLLVLRDVTEERRALATRRDFVANASHELRTPVAAIRGAAETLLGGALESPGAARSFVEIISRQAERLARLTQDLLDLSRLESRQWRFERLPIDVAQAAAQVVELHAPLAERKGLEVRSAVPEGLSVLGDARALEQVLVNLVENAVKYTPEGSVTVSAAPEGGQVEIVVSDTGPGIEARHLPRIFERFYRIDPGRAREAGGTGVGLAIVKHLVQGMGGEIGVESGAGGTRFRVRLPAVSRAGVQAE